MRPARHFPRWIKALALATAFLAFLGGFMETKASEELARARALVFESNEADAAIHYFRSNNWYLPVGSTSQTDAD
ncbi:MAG: hypothetical protein LBT40_16400 [Deltaproteobacteria bacterium]|jgi:hypothetical protein|nr:hypothetical protein [Deltaproteobacteria bacterium]